MLSLPPGIQVFMALEPVDMRKSFDGLIAAVKASSRATCSTATCSCSSIGAVTG